MDKRLIARVAIDAYPQPEEIEGQHDSGWIENTAPHMM
jgi:hypothetical protein